MPNTTSVSVFSEQAQTSFVRSTMEVTKALWRSRKHYGGHERTVEEREDLCVVHVFKARKFWLSRILSPKGGREKRPRRNHIRRGSIKMHTRSPRLLGMIRSGGNTACCTLAGRDD